MAGYQCFAACYVVGFKTFMFRYANTAVALCWPGGSEGPAAAVGATQPGLLLLPQVAAWRHVHWCLKLVAAQHDNK
jgi:hypothetical protein